MADTNLLILAREFKTLRNHVQEVLKMPVGPQGLQGEKGEQGVKGDTGAFGKNGKDGKDGVNGLNGSNGINGKDGEDGKDGLDGVGVQNAYIDFDNSLVIVLTSGQEINAGFLSQETKDAVVATFKQGAATLNELLPVQTGNAGKYLTTDGTNTSWASIAGGLSYQGTWNASTNTPTLTSGVGVNGSYYIVATAGSTNLDGITDWQIGDWLMFNGTVWQKIDQSNLVTSVNGQTGVVILNAANVGAEPADATILKDADIGVTVQGYSAVLAGTTASFTTADETKLDGIASGAEVNVNADWNAVSGDAQILNKPTLYSDAAVDTHLNTSTATSAQVLSWTGTDYDWVTPSAGGGSALTISNKTGAYTVVAGDLGTIINCTANTFTVSLTAAATLGAGFNVTIWNTSTTATHAITIDPAGTETIDGLTTLILRRGEGMQIVCNGTNWETGDKKTMRGYAENIPNDATRPVASGAFSLSLGALSQATGIGAIAIGGETFVSGTGATATANTSIAIGSGAGAASASSTAIGQNSGSSGSKTATGTAAMALGGSYASGSNSFAAAIANNTSTYGATGSNSIAMGDRAKATAQASVAIGTFCEATATSAVALGSGVASALYSVAIGGNGTTDKARASGKNSFAFGDNAKAVEIGKFAFASNGGFSSSDIAQLGMLVLRRATTDATATVLTTDNAAASTTNQIILPDNSAFAFTGTIIARQQAAGGSNFAAWEIKGGIIRNGTAATTSLGSFNINTLSKTAGASAWTIALTADTTNGGLAITVTGAAATNIRWVATVQTSEVTYA